ncbi:HAD-IA family hydrolase [Actinacidiphila glaucinigra]|uniref:HAD-IA family hydrolase n=1 Tax=Actinacidiphila glaucinigra TaxID=235986 RepID=UPI0036960AA0
MKPTRPSAESYRTVVLDYNGVIGTQPDPVDWTRLATLAGWPHHRTHMFEQAFWARRSGYDAGVVTAAEFWSSGLVLRTDRTLGSLLPELIDTDTRMWTRTDPAVVELLQEAHRSGTRLLLLSNAPHCVADALDGSDWASTLMSKTVYSARIGVNKPARRAYEAALAAAQWPNPAQVLFVDDRAENCQAAARLGMGVLHYTGDPGLLAQHLPRLPQPPAVQRPAAAAASSAAAA